MTLTDKQRISRLEKRLLELELWVVQEALNLDGWTFDGKPHEHGTAWPTREGVVTLACDDATVPDGWPLKETRLDLDLGGEGLVRLRYGSGAEDAFAIDANHTLFRLREKKFSISAECVARLPFGVPNRNARLERVRLVRLEERLSDFILRLRQVIETANTLGDHEAVEPLLSAAESALRQLEWPSASDTYVARAAPGEQLQKVWELPKDLVDSPDALNDHHRESVETAADLLVEGLQALKERYPQTGALALTGHAHIDLAWLWPLAETRRKANRTFHTVIGLMERYPDFRFNQSTAQLYAFLEEDDPALFAAIKDRVSDGRWEPIGGMWVEPDLNMPTGESLVRQLLYGQRYFERTFGGRHTVCWVPDCFGFSPALPQLLRLAGIDSFFTIKVNWSETNLMPFDFFWWEGLDGSRVLAHTFRNPVGGYNAEIGPRAVAETWRNYRGKHLRGESLLSFGFGDGGGGPTEEMLERQRQLADFPLVPSLRSVNVADWFASAHAQAGETELPLWVGEMYLELHRGTLTTQGRTKYLHRRAERALITAETLASMAAMLGAPIAISLEDQWRIVLRNEFHDILPGSSIREVYEEAEAELASVVAEGARKSEEHLIEIAAALGSEGAQPGVLVVNPDLSPRPLRLISPSELPEGQATEDGSVIAGDRVAAPLSAAVMLSASPPEGLAVEPRRLENKAVEVTLAEDGTLASVYDKVAGREALAARGNQIWAYVDKPRSWDAWDIEEDYRLQGEEITATEPPEVVESGPHRGAIRVVRRYRDSEIVQTIRLWANSARLDIKTDVDWHERRILLKARFPVAVRSDHAVFDCAHGVVRRPTHRNTSWDQAKFEVAAHRFVDLSEQGYGVALMNDGKYGHHALGNELGLSLLRSPVYPDPRADEGRQNFTYALYPHGGDWLSGGVLAEAEDLNQPLLCRPVRADAEHSWTAAKVDGLQLGLSAFKPSEAGDALILRTYEPAGARGTVRLTLPPGWTLGEEVDLLENSLGPSETTVLPHKVHSWRIERS
jgi:alpha-mannosidase